MITQPPVSGEPGQAPNAPGIFEATCDAIKLGGKQAPAKDLTRPQPPIRETIPPGARATFRCVQIVGSLPKEDTMPADELRINRRRAFFVS